MKNEAKTAKNQILEDIKAFRVEHKEEPQETVEHPRVSKFSVTDPTLVNKNMKYTVHGEDEDGDFVVVRRYREFDALVQVLKSRWLGCYVPSIPEKKFVNA